MVAVRRHDFRPFVSDLNVVADASVQPALMALIRPSATFSRGEKGVTRADFLPIFTIRSAWTNDLDSESRLSNPRCGGFQTRPYSFARENAAGG